MDVPVPNKFLKFSTEVFVSAAAETFMLCNICTRGLFSCGFGLFEVLSCSAFCQSLTSSRSSFSKLESMIAGIIPLTPPPSKERMRKWCLLCSLFPKVCRKHQLLSLHEQQENRELKCYTACIQIARISLQNPGLTRLTLSQDGL